MVPMGPRRISEGFVDLIPLREWTSDRHEAVLEWFRRSLAIAEEPLWIQYGYGEPPDRGSALGASGPSFIQSEDGVRGYGKVNSLSSVAGKMVG